MAVFGSKRGDSILIGESELFSFAHSGNKIKNKSILFKSNLIDAKIDLDISSFYKVKYFFY